MTSRAYTHQVIQREREIRIVLYADDVVNLIGWLRLIASPVLPERIFAERIHG
jgi:hypothetical protein